MVIFFLYLFPKALLVDRVTEHLGDHGIRRPGDEETVSSLASPDELGLLLLSEFSACSEVDLLLVVGHA